MTALARGLSVLRCFGGEQSELSTTELARMTGLPQPTVWRLCHTLMCEGYLIGEGRSGKFRVGLGALALGYAALARQTLAELALAPMQDLTRRSALSLSLTARDGLDVVHLQRSHGNFTYVNDPVGSRRPFTLAPSGWASYVAYDAATRDALDGQIATQYPERWSAIRLNLQRAADEYARFGYVFSLGTLHGQLNAVAVPIRLKHSGEVFGLSAAGLAVEWPEARLHSIGRELTGLAELLADARS